MNSKILFYREESKFENHERWVRKHIGDLNLDPIIIDRKGDLLKRKSKSLQVYTTLDEALENKRNKNFNWIWFHPKGNIFLDEFKHPKENIIYAVGSDYNGFDGKLIDDLPGIKIRLRENTEIFSAIVIPKLCYDRFLYLINRRK